MKTLITNLENGNLTEARKLAKRFSYHHIVLYLRDNLQWSIPRSVRAAHYLKTGTGWQLYCDTK